MFAKPLTQTAACGKAYQLLDGWLERWPDATLNGWGTAQAWLGLVDAVAPLLAAPDPDITVEDLTETFLRYPVTQPSTGDADSASAAFTTVWMMLLNFWHPAFWLPVARWRRPPPAPRPLPFIHATLLVILSQFESLTMDELDDTITALQVRVGDHSVLCFAHGEASDLPLPARVTVLCLCSPTAADADE